ncbi:TonB-dependent receptor [Chroococcidiopsis thermalis]|uniref:TonB-dependent siderophore receptor n=1 Tax=Chroococcidiopsis thermalis (strain PCC 7203) TaxID=251229 RepID=K9TZ09_CHRTP|nr:TonB-dependent receptor [Chroococcidiopsis thermalis]AFY87401.1 TonB-dependent siderophore receptor [Chroococcidiopsis thermalis PCC 7203]
MKSQIYSLLLVVSAAVAIAPTVCATEAESIPPTPLKKGGNLLSPTPQNTAKSNLLSLTPLLKGEAAGGRIWGSLAQSRIIQVTNVQLQQTDKGLAVILETPEGESLQVFPAGFGNTFVANIPNAQLAEGKTVRQENPASGIASIAVTQQGTNNIRVTVTGTRDLPKVEVATSDRALTLTLLEALAPTAQQPAPPASTAPPQTQATPEATPPQEAVPPKEGETQQPTTTQGEEQEIVVTDERETGYSVPDASTATRTDTPIRDIPQSIQVIPQQVLEDQRAIRLKEALRNVSGVSEDSNFGGALDRFNIRGFSQNTVLRDGFRIGEGGLRETANLERIEILKGPASVLYGSLEPGGIVNLVTKQPLSEPFYSFDFQAGSYDLYRPSIDLSGPLNADKTLLYRLNAVYESSDSFRDYDQNTERFFIAPVLTWKIGDNTSLNFEFDYLNLEQPFDRGVVAFGDGVADIPITRVLGDPNDVYKLEEIGAGYRLEHRFNENLLLRNAFRFQQSNTFDQKTQPGELDEATGDFIERRFDSNDDTEKRYALQTDLTGKFSTGSIQHTLLFGFDLAREEGGGTNNGLPFTPDINIFNPVYGFRRPLSEYTVPRRDDFSKTDRLGIFLQDQIALLDNLKLLIGGRFDVVDQESEDRLEDTSSSQSEDAFSPRIGIVYQPIEPISLYASYSQSFVPNSATRVDGSFLEPERGTQYEVGIKGELFDGRLAATLAGYEITKKNVGTTDPDNPDFSLPLGEVRSRGIEFDVNGEILPGWNIIASYGHIDSEVTASSDPESFPVGLRTANVPRNTASLWTTYRIQSGDLQGLGFGIGLFHADEKPGDDENTYELPSYVRTDAAIFYRRNNWQAAINFRNLFDVKYYESVNFGRGAIQPGTPFTVIGSFSVEF